MTKKLEDILNLPNVKEAFAKVDAKEKDKENKSKNIVNGVQKNVDPETAKNLEKTYAEFDKMALFVPIANSNNFAIDIINTIKTPVEYSGLLIIEYKSVTFKLINKNNNPPANNWLIELFLYNLFTDVKSLALRSFAVIGVAICCMALAGIPTTEAM